MFQSILPTESRVQMFQYLYGHPVQMNVYGHAITYGTIGTVVAGILAAFASKILLQEIFLESVINIFPSLAAIYS